MSNILNSLFRLVYNEDIAKPTFDANGDIETVAVKNNAGMLVYVTPQVADFIAISKKIFNDTDFDLEAGDSIEDALLSLKAQIGDYEYSLPSLYDTNIIGSDDTTSYIGVTTGSTQKVINKHLYDLIDAVSIPTVPEFDTQIKTSTATNSALNLGEGSNVSDALIILESLITDNGTADNVVTISQITLDAITSFNGNTQSDMNIFLNSKIDAGSGSLIWEQYDSQAIIKPTILSGQTKASAIMMDNRPIYFSDDVNKPRIVVSTVDSNVSFNYDQSTIKIQMGDTTSLGKYVHLQVDGSNNVGLKVQKFVNNVQTSLGENDGNVKLSMDNDVDNGLTEVSLTYDVDTGIFMNKDNTYYNFNILNNGTSQCLLMSYNSNTYTSKVDLKASESIYLSLGISSYGGVKLNSGTTQYLSLNPSSPGGDRNLELRNDENVYLMMEDEKIALYISGTDYISLNENRLDLIHDKSVNISANIISLYYDFYGFKIDKDEDVIKLGYKTGIGALGSSGLMIGDGYMRMDNLPEYDPNITNTLWNDNGIVKISL